MITIRHKSVRSSVVLGCRVVGVKPEGKLVLCWCPFCKTDHSHMLPLDFRYPFVEHRVPHCSKSFTPSGYFITLLREVEL